MIGHICENCVNWQEAFFAGDGRENPPLEGYGFCSEMPPGKEGLSTQRIAVLLPRDYTCECGEFEADPYSLDQYTAIRETEESLRGAA